MNNPDEYGHEALEFARAVTFFDAIFAFAVTLLITNVDDFSADAWTSLGAMWDANGSSLTAFAISFVVVVTFWRSNHQEVTRFRALDRQVVLLNCAVMFAVVLIPFTSEALGKTRLADLPLPVAVYAVNIIVAYLLQVSVVYVADRRGLLVTRMTRPERKARLIRNAVLPVVFLSSIPIAYGIDPHWAEWSWTGVALLLPFTRRTVLVTDDARANVTAVVGQRGVN